jgi:hypothetical protein
MSIYKFMGVTPGGYGGYNPSGFLVKGRLTANTAQPEASDTSKIISHNQDRSGYDVKRLMDYASHLHCAAVC